jgi:TPR repeat protein
MGSVLRKIWSELQNIIGYLLNKAILMGNGISADAWRKGLVLPSIVVRSADYYRLSAEQGNSNGPCNVGRSLKNGIENASAEQGNASEQHNSASASRLTSELHRI